ncbi:hypothetical protein AYJ54_00690 [Bradyrhizobium centrolobii]|uniref:Uncharacterized protein n=1 Tax=Bradyrhizobium centrolobii TaxID=1505087 RepID=A0A176YHS0_9BRAD|nr:hypothetical protein AYJ54_00690 [Bradyrhizobium centrolobii]
MKQPRLAPLRDRAACGTCEFGEMHESNDTQFYCRRRAPVLVNSGKGAVFPIVDENDWCGDFREEVDAT